MKVTAITRAAEHRRSRPCGRIADGVELLGEYQGSGFREAPYLVRRADGHVVQVTRMLYEVLARCDGRRGSVEIAREVGEELDRTLGAEDVAFLVEQRLAPAGLVSSADMPSAEAPAPAAPPFALNVRAAVVPARVVRVLAAATSWLFAPVLVGAVLAWLAVFDAWLLVRHGLDGAFASLLAQPAVILLVYGLVVGGTILHEIGHAAACRYGGARPGRLGLGLYYVWPVFYTDVTDAYRLDRGGRVRTDLGGVYFNALFSLGLAAAYFHTGFEPLLVVVLIQHVQAAQQLVPWLRLDGYYVLTDVVGVPDVLSRVRPILASLVPGREPDARVRALRPWVRAVVSTYVVVTVPAFFAAYAFLVWHLPDIARRTAAALRVHLDLAEAAWRAGDDALTAVAAVNVLALLLPAVGVTIVLATTLRRLLRPLARRVGPVPGLRAPIAFGAGAAAAALFFAGYSAQQVVEPRATVAKRVAPAVVKPPKPKPRPRVRKVQAPVAPRRVAQSVVPTMRAPRTPAASEPAPAAPPPAATTTASTAEPVAEPPPVVVVEEIPPETTSETATETTPAVTEPTVP